MFTSVDGQVPTSQVTATSLLLREARIGWPGTDAPSDRDADAQNRKFSSTLRSSYSAVS